MSTAAAVVPLAFHHLRGGDRRRGSRPTKNRAGWRRSEILVAQADPCQFRCLQDRNQSIPLIRAHHKRVRSIPMIHPAPVLLSVFKRYQQTRTFDHRYLSSQTSSMRQLLMMLLTIIVQPFTGGSQQ